MRRSTSKRFFLVGLGMLAMMAFSAPARSQVAVGISVGFAPPELPVYDQPPCPGEDYIWTPGYWDWDADDGDYFWVPGTWVLSPEPGFFWTPGYWAWGPRGFFFNAGYWGPVVGFYGGISYGFGYFGHGYEGGRWDHGHFFYNRAVNNVNVTVIHNTYNTTIINENRTVNRVSFNGGNGGVEARATSQEEAAARERHVGPVSAQMQHVQQARSNRDLRASVNHGAPPVAATAKPAQFNEGVVKTREAGRVNTPPPGNARPGNNGRVENNARPENNTARPSNVIHPNELPAYEKPAAPNTGNPKLDQKYQKQQEKLQAQQEKDRQKLQQQQEKEHQQIQKQQANEANKQQMEQRHQQQTQQMQQRHEQQRQQLQQRQAPPPPRPGKPHS